MTSSPSVVNLACGELRCDLRPDLGAAIAGLWLGPVAVLRSTDALAMDNPRQGGCFPLGPFSNRIGQARLEWEGQTYELESTPPGPHAIHGVGWQRPWTVTEQEPHRVAMAYSHTLSLIHI